MTFSTKSPTFAWQLKIKRAVNTAKKIPSSRTFAVTFLHQNAMNQLPTYDFVRDEKTIIKIFVYGQDFVLRRRNSRQNFHWV